MPDMELLTGQGPEELKELILGCLAVSPSDRPSFSDLVRRLDRSQRKARRAANRALEDFFQG